MEFSCRQFRERTTDALDGRLLALDVQRFEAHRVACAACAQEWAVLGRMRTQLLSLGTETAPPGLATALSQRIRKEEPVLVGADLKAPNSGQRPLWRVLGVPRIAALLLVSVTVASIFLREWFHAHAPDEDKKPPISAELGPDEEPGYRKLKDEKAMRLEPQGKADLLEERVEDSSSPKPGSAPAPALSPSPILNVEAQPGRGASWSVSTVDTGTLAYDRWERQATMRRLVGSAEPSRYSRAEMGGMLLAARNHLSTESETKVLKALEELSGYKEASSIAPDRGGNRTPNRTDAAYVLAGPRIVDSLQRVLKEIGISDTSLPSLGAKIAPEIVELKLSDADARRLIDAVESMPGTRIIAAPPVSTSLSVLRAAPSLATAPGANPAITATSGNTQLRNLTYVLCLLDQPQ